VLPFAEAEVVWCRVQSSSLPGRYPGFGVRFQRFLHPRAEDLVAYLMANLDTGRPLTLAPTPRRWRRTLAGAGLAVAGMSALGALSAWSLLAREPVQVPMVRAFEAAVPLALSAKAAHPAPDDELEPLRRPAGDEAGREAGVPPPVHPEPVEGSAHIAPPLDDSATGAGAAVSGTGAASTVIGSASTGAGAASPGIGSASTGAGVASPGIGSASTGAAAASPVIGSSPTGATSPNGSASNGAGAASPPIGSASNGVGPASPPIGSTSTGVGPASPVPAATSTGAGAAASAPTAVPSNELHAASPAPAPGALSPGAREAAAPPSALRAAAEEPEEPVKPHPALPPPRSNETRGEVVLPSGAARAVSWALADRELRLAANLGAGTLRKAFVMYGPPRVVFDVDGAAPLKSLVIAGATPFIKQVRVGRQGEATRVVVDLSRAPADVSPDGDAFILSF
jgi:hypothetical protein